MKKYGTYHNLILLLGLTIYFTNCFHEEPNNDWMPDTPFNVTVHDIRSITMTSVVYDVFIGLEGRAPITTRGVCWSTSERPTIADKIKNKGSGKESFTDTITGLSSNTKYYIRGYATNKYGTGYGDTKTFITLPELPVVTTSSVIKFTNTSALIGGTVSSEGLTTVIDRGVYWGISPNPESTGTKIQIGSGSGPFSTDLMVLIPKNKYYVKAYAINSQGTVLGEEVTFTTNIDYSLPFFATTPVNKTTLNSATSGGEIIWDGGSAISVRGICWSTTQNPTTADYKTTDLNGIGKYNSELTDLLPNTTYYVRAYAINSLGTAYGNQLSFTTRTGTIIDVEGNIYYTQTIGTQTWMAENLRTRKFKNNSEIPLVTDNAAWSALKTPGYCWYKNSEDTYGKTFGAMYNWYTVNTGLLCPTGWHVPTDLDWVTLINFLGGENIAGMRLKEAGTEHWIDTNNGNNESGFTALPGGFRDSMQGGYFDISVIHIGSGVHNDREGIFWSSTTFSSTFSWIVLVGNKEDNAVRLPYPNGIGISVRCIKD